MHPCHPGGRELEPGGPAWATLVKRRGGKRKKKDEELEEEQEEEEDKKERREDEGEKEEEGRGRRRKRKRGFSLHFSMREMRSKGWITWVGIEAQLCTSSLTELVTGFLRFASFPSLMKWEPLVKCL